MPYHIISIIPPFLLSLVKKRSLVRKKSPAPSPQPQPKNWVENPQILAGHVQPELIRCIESANARVAHRPSDPWWTDRLTLAQRAAVILPRALKEHKAWRSCGVQQYYERLFDLFPRATVLRYRIELIHARSESLVANVGHRHGYRAECIYCRQESYKIITLSILVDVLTAFANGTPLHGPVEWLRCKSRTDMRIESPGKNNVIRSVRDP